jgi:hypothetical protein
MVIMDIRALGITETGDMVIVVITAEDIVVVTTAAMDIAIRG